MKLSYQIHWYGTHFREVAERIVAFEEVGLDIVWASEAYSLDAITIIGFIAARTTRVQLGTSILPIFSRSPALLAQTAAGLDWVSDGRAILGLGTSGPQVVEGWHGLPYTKPMQRTREVVEICRRVWRRELLDFQGEAVTVPLPPEQGTGLGKPLKIIAHPRRPRIPIFLAPLGPRNVQLTAEIARLDSDLLFCLNAPLMSGGPPSRRAWPCGRPSLDRSRSSRVGSWPSATM